MKLAAAEPLRSGAGGRSPLTERRAAWEAFALGILFDLASIFVANPYVVSLLVLPLVGFAILRWQRRWLPWVALASVLAANPVNLSASIACNLLVAVAYLFVHMPDLRRTPRWLVGVNALALLSVLASIPFWNGGLTVETFFTQGASVANYVLGPFLLLPFLYRRASRQEDASHLANSLLLWLVLPTILTLAVARAFGTPVNPSMSPYDLELAAVYTLGNVEITLTRTQVGIVLAGLGCASFALFVAGTRGPWRGTAGATLGVVGSLMLLTGSIGSALALAAGFGAVLFAAAGRVNIRQYVLAGAAVALVAAAMVRFLPSSAFEYVGGRVEERFEGGIGGGAGDRVALWAQAWDYATDQPMGVGWSLLIERLGIYPHSDYLSYAIAYGLLCGLLYAYVVGRLLWTFARKSRIPASNYRLGINLAGLGAITVLAVNSTADHLAANRWYFNVLWSVVWLCYFSTEASDDGSPERGHRP